MGKYTINGLNHCWAKPRPSRKSRLIGQAIHFSSIRRHTVALLNPAEKACLLNQYNDIYSNQFETLENG